jgi:hypothetical protein
MEKVMEMLLKTELKPWQSKAVDKLSYIKIGALYLEQGLRQN